MNMGYMYPQQNASASNQIAQRPMTRAEAESGVKLFKFVQTQIRLIALVPLIIMAVNVLLLGSDYIVSIIALVLSLVVIAASMAFLVFSRKVTAVLKTGMVIEVRAPVYRAQSQKNMPMYSVGPIMLFASPEVARLVVEGQMASIGCIPKLKVALSVNNTSLARGAAITCPSNIEAMAVGANPQYPLTPKMQQQSP